MLSSGGRSHDRPAWPGASWSLTPTARASPPRPLSQQESQRTMSNNTTPAAYTTPGVPEVIALLRRMNPSERKRLFEQLEKRPSLLHLTGYTIVPVELLEMLKGLFRSGSDELVKLSKVLSRRKRRRAPE